MKNFMNWFKSEESGQGMVEYGLIIALVAIVVIAVLRALGVSLTSIFSEIGGELGGAGEAGASE